MVACGVYALAGRAGAASFTTFESGQVRPVALSPDGSRLFAVNTPDDRLEVFDVTAGGLVHSASVSVGVEPVAVAPRSDGEVWVVNHLSDSVSIVDVAADPPRVVRTLLVGDEPRDIVFAGTGGNRAFITTAHRGQQRTDMSIAAVPGAGDPQFTTEGIGRADVWVFEATALGGTIGGTPLRIVTLFGDTPRALAVGAGGGTVYAAIFKSGNQTTVVSEPAVCNGFASATTCVVDGETMPGGLPGPSTNSLGENAPETALIIKLDQGSGEWRDPLGRDWSDAVLFDLPDQDVFAIDADTLAQTAVFSHVGTTLFNMAVNPVNGAVYVSNTEARNEVRFEGPGVFGGSTVQGHLAESRITVLTSMGVFPRHLNKHIDYGDLPAAPGVKEHSLATPTGMVVSPDGTTLYVAAFGSGRIGVFDTTALENDTFQPTAASASYIDLSGGGPTGLVLDAARDRLYVLTRFDNAISVVDLATGDESAHLPLHNPEPAAVVAGRPFLYDALLTSSNGEASCSSCHVFGDMDDLSWDLGNPDDPVIPNALPINLAVAITTGAVVLPAPINGTGDVRELHPMKGPMTTQTLRGLDGSGAMHWRGDRAHPPGTAASAFNEVISFNNFNVAFPGLLGRESQLSTADMQKFTDFALQIMLPPNPVRALDNSLTPSQQSGRNFFMGPRLSDGIAGTFLGQPLGFTCEGCHRLQPSLGHFGTDGRASFENEQQIVKIPHLRNMYQKVGMFGGLDVAGIRPLNLPHQGPQIRGFGFLHDGSVDTLFRFFNAVVFSDDALGGPTVGFQSDAQRRDVEEFMLAFDTNFAPIVAQQITLTGSNGAVANPRVDLLLARAALGECEVIVKGVQDGEQRGWMGLPSGEFASDRAADAPVAEATLRALAGPGDELTYTCVAPGAGERAGIDRDEDGHLDRDELDAGSDPADPSSVPAPPIVPSLLIPASTLTLKDDPGPPGDPSRRRITFTAKTKNAAAPNRVAAPLPGGAGDPTVGGATLTVYNATGQTADAVTVNLPAGGWIALGSASNPKGWKFRGGTGDAIKTILVKDDRVVVRGGGSAFAYTLDETAQGGVAVLLQLGTHQGWCTAAAAQLTGSPPSTAKSDRPGLFKGTRQAAAPATCPSVP
jgi:DNA-binding beta-propeller fold protein YncE